MNNIIVRTLSGAVFVSLILIPLWFSKELATGIFSIFLLLGLIEFYRLFDKSEIVAINWKAASTVGFFIFAMIAGVIFNFLMLELLIFILPFIFLLFTAEIWRKKKNPLLNVAVIGFGHLYIILPFLMMIYLIKNDDAQFPLLAGMFILIWMNDTFAFLSGKFFGKTKLIERISPNKTWEGTIGGILFTLLAGVAIGLLFDTDNLIFWIISATIIAPCAVIGDLLESLFKRNAGVKDSGSIMPGHGGILDRFDATLLAMPVFFAWAMIYKFFC